jgi:hypothetical protein
MSLHAVQGWQQWPNQALQGTSYEQRRLPPEETGEQHADGSGDPQVVHCGQRRLQAQGAHFTEE